MFIKYNILIYFIPLIVFFGLLLGLYSIFKNKSNLIKTLIVVILMALNLFQHFFKFIVWKGLYTKFDYMNTAYNVCALLIIISPIFYLSKSNLLREFISLLGSIAGLGAMLFPIWFFGNDIEVLELIRFYFCHGILLLQSLLPLLFKQYKVEFKNFWYLPMLFIGCLTIIVFNYYICDKLNLLNGESFISSLKTANPFMIAGPTPNSLLEKIFSVFTPKFMMKTPILWYLVPLYLGVTLISFIVSLILDRDGYKKIKNK